MIDRERTLNRTRRTDAEIERPAVLWDRPLEGDVYGSAVAGDTVVLLTLKPGASEWTIEGHRAETGERAWQGPAPGTSLGPAVGGSIIVSGRTTLEMDAPPENRDEDQRDDASSHDPGMISFQHGWFC